MIYLITILIFGILLSFMAFISRDIRNPVNIFLTSWSIMLLALSIGLINYIEVPFSVYIYVLFSIILFSFFAVISSRIKFKSKFMVGKEIIGEWPLIFLGLLGLTCALFYYQTKFGLSNLIYNAGLVRSQDDGGSGLFGILLFIPANIFVILGIRSFYLKKISPPTFLCLLALFIYMLILPERTTLINSVVWLAFGSYALNPKNQFISWSVVRKYFPPVVLVITAFIGFFIVVSERTGKIKYIDQISYAINQNFSIPNQVIEPYIYITANIPALGAVFESGEFSDGFNFDPSKTGIFFKRAVQIFTSSPATTTSNAEFIEVPFRFNTYTWLYEPLADYGIVGSFIYIVLIGIMSGLIWSLRSAHISPLTAYLYGGIATACLFTILTNKFSSVYFSYAVITVILLHITLGKPKKAEIT